MAVNSSEAADAAGSRLKSELGTAAAAADAFGVSISEGPVIDNKWGSRKPEDQVIFWNEDCRDTFVKVNCAETCNA